MSVVDLRYARALDEVVTAQGLDRKAVKSQLNDLLSTFEASAPLREIFENPSIAEDGKLRVLDGIASRLGISRAVRNFLAVIMHHERLHELGPMIHSYLEIADVESSVAEAEVTSARALDGNERQAMERSVAQLTGASSVRATYREDPALLGGAVLRVGSTVYDGSVRGQLEQMKQQMIAATI